MKANELRIGNWVKFGETLGVKKKYRGQHTRLTMDNIMFIDTYPSSNKYKPIELSSDIFEKCGFTHDKFSDDGTWFDSHIGVISKHEDGFTMPDSDGDPSLGYVLQHLHQLQNLYYALTGQELNYKP